MFVILRAIQRAESFEEYVGDERRRRRRARRRAKNAARRNSGVDVRDTEAKTPTRRYASLVTIETGTTAATADALRRDVERGPVVGARGDFESHATSTAVNAARPAARGPRPRGRVGSTEPGSPRLSAGDEETPQRVPTPPERPATRARGARRRPRGKGGSLAIQRREIASALTVTSWSITACAMVGNDVHSTLNVAMAAVGNVACAEKALPNANHTLAMAYAKFL